MSELLAAEVRGPAGEAIGVVVDVRLIQDGPPQGFLLARIRVAALVVGPRRHVRLWGYERSPDVGPWPIRAIVRGLSHGARSLDWADCRLERTGSALVVHSRLPRDRLPRSRDLPVL